MEQCNNTHTPAALNSISEPYEYLRRYPGKEVRKRLISAFNVWLEIDEQSMQTIQQVIEMLHTASLLIDDVEDGSSLRRGLPTAHRMFGIPLTINSANLMYFRALQSLGTLSDGHTAEDTRAFAEELIRLHEGQGLEIYHRDAHCCPSEADYLFIIANKTGGLFRLAVRLMQARSQSNLDVLPLAESFGVLFQLCDDYLNLVSKTYADQKGFCEDLTEGKYTLPIIHCIRDGCHELDKILAMRPTEHTVKEHALELLKQHSSIEYAQEQIGRWSEKIGKLVAALPRNDTFLQIFETLMAPPS